ncbi:hypothetical protein [Xylanimonas sp. McL0601]|uniref:hypothetical protein n=1 Tax=Xylanimonas sp. McL0601 TaxID=3414739 RepID=UPI003CF57D68
MTGTTLPFGTAMALAERNLSGPLTRILSEERTELGAWFTLNALGLRGPSPRGVLTGLLSTNGYGDGKADALLERLAADGLLEGTDTVRLTAAGADRFTALTARITSVTRRVFALFDPGQVESTRALLQQIAEVDPATIESVAFGPAS